jgi:hypothetical protein
MQLLAALTFIAPAALGPKSKGRSRDCMHTRRHPFPSPAVGSSWLHVMLRDTRTARRSLEPVSACADVQRAVKLAHDQLQLRGALPQMQAWPGRTLTPGEVGWLVDRLPARLNFASPVCVRLSWGRWTDPHAPLSNSFPSSARPAQQGFPRRTATPQPRRALCEHSYSAHLTGPQRRASGCAGTGPWQGMQDATCNST